VKPPRESDSFDYSNKAILGQCGCDRNRASRRVPGSQHHNRLANELRRVVAQRRIQLLEWSQQQISDRV
jgi:hypothetical protein